MKKINPFDYAREIALATPYGILLTSKADNRVNTMTIGWGTLGTEWGLPVFTVYVRTSRFTHDLLERNPEFTVNIPIGPYDKTLIAKAGIMTGRKVDKIAALGLTPVPPQVVSVPAIREFPLTLECRVIYKTLQALSDIHCRGVKDIYPEGIDNLAAGRNSSPHTAYYGEIVSAYILE